MEVILEVDPGCRAEATLAVNRHIRMIEEKIRDGSLPRFIIVPQGALLLSPEFPREQPIPYTDLFPILLEESRR